MKEIKDDLSKWKDIACSLRLEDLILRCSNIQSNPQIQCNLYQNFNGLFCRNGKANHQIYMESQAISANSQSNLEKEQLEDSQSLILKLTTKI